LHDEAQPTESPPAPTVPAPIVEDRSRTRPRVTARAATSKPSTVAAPLAPSVASASSATFADELARLERARAEAHENPEAALRTLDEHARDYPTTQFHEESTVIRVEALLAAGRRADAERLAAPLVDARSDAPIARRLRDLLAGR